MKGFAGYGWAEVGKVTLLSDGKESLSDESL